MAWLEQHPTSRHFRICFLWNGRKLKKTVKTENRKIAEAALSRFAENLGLLERGRLELPDGADVGTFLLSDGKLVGHPTAPKTPQFQALSELRAFTVGNGQVEAHNSSAVETERKKQADITLGEIKQRFVDGQPDCSSSRSISCRAFCSGVMASPPMAMVGKKVHRFRSTV